MPTKRCSWGTCNSDNRYMDREHMAGVTFFPFPKPSRDLERCRLWIKQCGRPHSDLSVDKIQRHHFVCSKHFPSGAVDPVAATYEKFTTSTPRPNRKRAREQAAIGSSTEKKKCEEQHTDEGQKSDGIDSIEDIKSPGPLPIFHNIVNHNEEKNPTILSSPTSPSVAIDMFDNNDENNPNTTSSSSVDNDKNIQTEDNVDGSFVFKITKSGKDCFYYVGIPTLELLMYLFVWILPAARRIKLWDGNRKGMSGRKGGKLRSKLFEEMLLTLVKIRRGYGNKHLSYLFNISESQVCRVFLAWVNLLSQCLSDFIIWPSKEVVKHNLPSSFSNYPNTRAIIDCTEYFIQKPLRPSAQKATWSNYKHSNTLKQLVAITPCGSISFLSNIYSGSISDVAIVNESKFVDLVEQGDDIMADRGFNIRHLLLPKKATLNIPPFTHGKILSSKAVKRSRQIAKVRIHVERAIRRMKTYKILSGIIPLRFRFIVHQLTIIVAALCNLQPCLA